jgi:DNA-binding SARP family transcriptional activator
MLRDIANTDGRRIDLQLFGWWNLRSKGVPVPLGHREQRLVALLALQGSRPRTHVAGTLWPDTTDDRALASLRAAVLHIRRTVGELLDTSRTTIGLRPDVHVDVADLHQCVDDIAHSVDVDPTRAMTIIEHADLLPGWYEDWVLFERERLEHVRLRALEDLAVNELARGEPVLAVEAAEGAIGIEPLRETAHALVIQAHIAAGNRSAAIRAYQLYRLRLMRELGIEPSPDVFALIRPIVGSGRTARSAVETELRTL